MARRSSYTCNYLDYIEYEVGKVYPLYTEFVYKANPKNLSNSKLMALYFSAYRNYTSCNLQATFKINALKKSRTSKCNIDLGGIKLNKISLSPLGITFFGSEDKSYSVGMTVYATMANGSVEIFGTLRNEKFHGSDGFSYMFDFPYNIMATSGGHGSNGELSLKFICNEPFDYEKVVSVTVNGNTVTLK